MGSVLKDSTLGSIIRACVGLKIRRVDVNRETKAEAGTASPEIENSVERDEKAVIGWSGQDDLQNPLNWSLTKKCIVTAILNYYTFAIFIGSSLYTPSQEEISRRFNVSHTKAELGLALYVLGYGAGALFFSPVTEIPWIGRNPPYTVSGTIFIILCIPAALVDNYPGLMVVRFLLGFVGSPCLATVVASYSDIWGESAPYTIALWAGIASLAPSLGPMIAAFPLPSMGWQFWAWELLILSGPAWVLMFCMVPETSADTILYYRGRRLRKETGNTRITSEEEIKQANIEMGPTLWFALLKPWEINAKDPAMLFATIYTGLSYGLVYSFFESLPLVYPVFYGFSPTSTALVFITTAPSVAIAFTVQALYLKHRVLSRLRAGTFGDLENHLISGMLASPLMPIGLFIFGWTSRPSIHWIVSVIGMAIIMISIYFTQQSIFVYIAAIYPKYAASIFAANSLSRSLLAFAAVLFTRPMIERLGVSGGISLLAGLTLGCAVGMLLLWKYGKILRAKSTFALD